MNFPTVKPTGFEHLSGVRGTATGTIAILNRTLSATGSVLSGLLTSFQVARMASILTEMSDRQLEDIGITRREILSHADYLITNKKHGR